MVVIFSLQIETNYGQQTVKYNLTYDGNMDGVSSMSNTENGYGFQLFSLAKATQDLLFGSIETSYGGESTTMDSSVISAAFFDTSQNDFVWGDVPRGIGTGHWRPLIGVMMYSRSCSRTQLWDTVHRSLGNQFRPS